MSTEFLNSSVQDRILEITMQMNSTNIINAGFGEAFKQVLADAAADESLRAIIIKGSNGYFSNGFDPSSFAGTDRAAVDAVIGPSFRLCKDVLYHPLPIASVINGHAMGMGAILTLYTDFRFMQQKQARFGFPEIQIGLPIPLAPALMLQDLVGRQLCRDMTMGPKALKADQCLEAGLVDGIGQDETELMEMARKELKKLFKYPRITVQRNREAIYTRYRDRLEQFIEIDCTSAADEILAPAGQAGLSALRDNKRPDFSHLP
ncbi:MAG: enoyl-CoA hydratase/isomerase family protein [Leptospiraceae bacterium]|nr:enoyl-CoA hydratase/isomerase family protein [Leptospiraceae bacterium]